MGNTNPIEIGSRFTRLVVVKKSIHPTLKGSAFECACDCGAVKVVTGYNLKNGLVKSCGCYHNDYWREQRTTHGLSKTSVYNAWSNMKRRCLNPRHPQYSEYGGRGITVSDEWLSFDSFFADMGHPPAGTSLDRIDNNKGYSKENCRWATKHQQVRNTRRNALVTIEDKTLCLAEWAAISGLSEYLIRQRMLLGWSASDAVFKEKMKRGYRY